MDKSPAFPDASRFALHGSRFSSDVAISVQNVSKKYRLYDTPKHRLKEALHPFRKKYHHNFMALNNVSFEVRKGETVGIVGKNGSGKSTLLQIICGILQPTAGEVIANGRISALLELGAGFNREFTGKQNVYMHGALLGLTKEEVDEKYDAIAEFADIGAFIDQPVKTYSSGMHVRLAFAAAINVDPDILVVDEALAVGDKFFQTKCMRKMRQLMEQNCTTLFVSHDTGAVKSLCSRAVYLDNGTVKFIGDSGDACNFYLGDQRERTGLFKQVGNEGPGPMGKDIVAPVVDAPPPAEELSFEKRVAYLRKGKGDVKIVSAAILDAERNEIAEVSFGQKLIFRAVYCSRIALPELVFAFYVKDKNQLEIIGTNNIYEHGKIKNIAAGDMNSVEFSFVNLLRAGDYTITAIIADSLDTTEYHDWIDGAAIFRSYDLPGERRWAFVNPPMEFAHSTVRSGRAQ